MKKQKPHRRPVRRKTTALEKKVIASNASILASAQKEKEDYLATAHVRAMISLMRSKMNDNDREFFDRFEKETQSKDYKPDADAEERHDMIWDRYRGLVTGNEVIDEVRRMGEHSTTEDVYLQHRVNNTD